MSVAGTPALAQEASAPEQEASSGSSTAGSNEIVVTGSRRRTTLQDAPINISAVSGEAIESLRLDDIRALGNFTPGVTIADTGPASTGEIILRGISSGDTSVNGANSNNAVGVYLGEVPLYLDFKLIDISRVEVLQGPQGTLYGLGTLAGAVRYIPNRPDTDRFSVDLHGTDDLPVPAADRQDQGETELRLGCCPYSRCGWIRGRRHNRPLPFDIDREAFFVILHACSG